MIDYCQIYLGSSTLLKQNRMNTSLQYGMNVWQNLIQSQMIFLRIDIFQENMIKQKRFSLKICYNWLKTGYFSRILNSSLLKSFWKSEDFKNEITNKKHFSRFWKWLFENKNWRNLPGVFWQKVWLLYH